MTLTLGWFGYALLIGLATGAAAWTLEWGARGRAVHRWLWLGAAALTTAMPLALLGLGPVERPDVVIVDLRGEVGATDETAAAPTRRGALPASATDPPVLSPEDRGLPGVGWDLAGTWAARRLAGIAAAPIPHASVFWAAASGLVLLLWGGASLRTVLLRRRWPGATVHGVRVALSDRAGPAVIGALDPVIVLPRRVLALPESDLRTVLAHERAHLEAGDTRLLAVGGALLALTPWNPLLWWQFARLRLALECDCDRRVVEGSADSLGYLRSLMALARPRTGRGVNGWGLGLAVGAGSHLVARARRLAARTSGPALAVASLAAIAIAVTACAIPRPRSMPAPAAESRPGEQTSGAGAAGPRSSPTDTTIAEGPVALRIGPLDSLVQVVLSPSPRERWRGVAALRVQAGPGGRPERMVIDAATGPNLPDEALEVALAAVQSSRILEGEETTSTGLDRLEDAVARLHDPEREDRPPRGWVPIWVVLGSPTIELHLVRRGLYREKGWPADHASLQSHMETLWNLRASRQLFDGLFDRGFLGVGSAATRQGAGARGTGR